MIVYKFIWTVCALFICNVVGAQNLSELHGFSNVQCFLLAEDVSGDSANHSCSGQFKEFRNIVCTDSHLCCFLSQDCLLPFYLSFIDDRSLFIRAICRYSPTITSEVEAILDDVSFSVIHDTLCVCYEGKPMLMSVNKLTNEEVEADMLNVRFYDKEGLFVRCDFGDFLLGLATLYKKSGYNYVQEDFDENGVFQARMVSADKYAYVKCFSDGRLSAVFGYPENTNLDNVPISEVSSFASDYCVRHDFDSVVFPLLMNVL